MRSFRKLKIALISSSIAIASCGHIKVYDREVCADLGKYGAHCAHTLTDRKRDIPKEKWDKERVGQLCMTSQAYTDAETAIDQFCTAYNLCDYQTREELQKAFTRIKRVKNKSDRMKVE